MATYYVQTSNWSDSRWATVHRTDDRRWAEYLADGLAVGEDEFAIGNPGAGVRHARAVAKTRLTRREGRAALVQAERDLQQVCDADYATIVVLRRAYEESMSDAGEPADFLIRDLPETLHRRLRAYAEEEEIPMREAVIRSIDAATAPWVAILQTATGVVQALGATEEAAWDELRRAVGPLDSRDGLEAVPISRPAARRVEAGDDPALAYRDGCLHLS